MSEICMIVACDENNAIGHNNKMPWHLPADLKYFKKQTTGHSVIMGRRTMESLGKALPNRRNIVISRNTDLKFENAEMAGSLENALRVCANEERVFIIGGGQIFTEGLALADKIYLTRIHHAFDADTYFPELSPTDWMPTKTVANEPDEKNNYSYSFILYERVGK